jgi:hypothetical protein
MPVLRIASLAIVALWVGGLSALALVAVPPEYTDRFREMTWYLGGALLILLGVRAALGPRPRRMAVQMSLAIAMLAATLFARATTLTAVTVAAGLVVFWIETKD